MKKIKIRFIERKNDFLIQRKTWFGWKYLSWTIDLGYGSCAYCYCEESKDELLREVLEHYYKIDRRFVQIIEYPSLKMY